MYCTDTRSHSFAAPSNTLLLARPSSSKPPPLPPFQLMFTQASSNSLFLVYVGTKNRRQSPGEILYFYERASGTDTRVDKSLGWLTGGLVVRAGRQAGWPTFTGRFYTTFPAPHPEPDTVLFIPKLIALATALFMSWQRLLSFNRYHYMYIFITICIYFPMYKRTYLCMQMLCFCVFLVRACLLTTRK